jgi:hypothetical protein
VTPGDGDSQNKYRDHIPTHIGFTTSSLAGAVKWTTRFRSLATARNGSTVPIGVLAKRDRFR